MSPHGCYLSPRSKHPGGEREQIIKFHRAVLVWRLRSTSSASQFTCALKRVVTRADKHRRSRNDAARPARPRLFLRDAMVVHHTSSTHAASSRQAVSGGGDFAGRLKKSAWSRSA
jgi:hypothetical protein